MSEKPNKIEFEMLDYKRLENDFVSFELEDGTVVKVKVDLDRVGKASNYKNPDGTPHYAISTAVKLSIIPPDKKFSVEKKSVKGTIWKKRIDSNNTENTIPIVVKIANIEQPNSTNINTVSTPLRAFNVGLTFFQP